MSFEKISTLVGDSETDGVLVVSRDELVLSEPEKGRLQFGKLVHVQTVGEHLGAGATSRAFSGGVMEYLQDRKA